MKIKKIFTIILVLIVALGMAAGYILSGFTPRQIPSQPTVSDFKGPVGEPFVAGPSSAPSIK